MPRIVALSGSLSRPSRTRALVHAIADALAQGHSPRNVQVDLIDIAEIAPALAAVTGFDNIPDVVRDAQELLARADVIVLGSPVYKGSYSGLFKHFIDLLDPAWLRGKVAVLAATGGSDRHALVLEHQWRPLASFLELHTVPAGVFVRDSEFENYQLGADRTASHERIALATAQARTLLGWQTQPAAEAPIALAA
ncbi:MAG TPA: NAD(P)H-dependent oxidoreductase [Roseateles sp.]|uniref:NAD(P)H-dependent oxidoreductase n=1 Tax=Roseateles sp. TaxID=1971397 RepID=UPI002ED8BCD9